MSNGTLQKAEESGVWSNAYIVSRDANLLIERQMD